MLVKAPYRGYRTHRNHLGMKTYLEVGDKVLVSPAVARLEHLEFEGRFIGIELISAMQSGGIPVFMIKHKIRGKIQRRKVRGYECWWVRMDEAERIKRRVAKQRRSQ